MDIFEILNICITFFLFYRVFLLVDAASQSTKYEKFADDKKLPVSLSVIEDYSLPQCASLCEHEPECISFSYNRAVQECELSDQYPEIALKVTEDDGHVADWAIYYKPNPACDFVFTVHLASEAVGTITSPNYPNKYNNNLDVKWLVVKPSETSTLYLAFHDMDVGRYTPCKEGDHIAIYDGACTDAPLHARFCGETTRQLIIHDSSIYVLINLITSPELVFRGFSMNYYVSETGEKQ